MARETKSYALFGGLDLVTPLISIQPGVVMAGENYEPVQRGYRRFQGFERFDGQPKPSEASYWILDFDGGTAAITEGQTVTGQTSGTSGKALIDAVVESGAYGTSDAAGYLVLTHVNGTFADDENLQVSAVTKSVADGDATELGAETDALNATYLQDAIETARALIAAVPGSGPVRGVWAYEGSVYAFRDNAGGTAGVMHKATASGWSTVALGRELAFTDGGTYEIEEGDTIEGATSSATAVVTRVVLQGGSWAAGDAEGYLIFASQTGTFEAENLDVGANANVATIAADSSAIALSAGGKYRFHNHNFFGASDLFRMYGVSGVDRAFEFDGSVFVPITTGMATDTPSFLAAHKKHLFLFFAGGSVQNSAIGNPYSWSAVLGAAEIGLGEEVTGALGEYANSLPIWGRNKISVLYGNDSSDWVLQEFSNDSGAIADTMQLVGVPLFLDDRGIRSLTTTDRFGDFNLGTITQMIEPLFRAKKLAGVTPTASVRVRSKDQYRLFWSDGTGITIYFGRKKPEALPFNFGTTRTVSSACSSEDANGNEIMFFGSDDGFVYQLDAGTSFDGDAIAAYLRLPFNHVGAPSHEKRWFKLDVEIDGSAATELGVLADFDYASDDQPTSERIDFTVRGGGGFWDEINWDEFYWSAPVAGRAEAPVDGIGRNISACIVSEAIYEEPHTVHGMTVHFSYRRLVR